VPKMGSGRHLTIRVEPAHERVTEAKLKAAREHLVESVKYRVNITPEVDVAEIGSLPRFEGKAKRVIRED